MGDERKLLRFNTGAVRDNVDIPRYDLIPTCALRRLALRYNHGCEKYSDRNWEKGIPYSNIYNHMQEHIQQYKSGDVSDDHLAAAAWGLFALMYFDGTRRHKLRINDLK